MIDTIHLWLGREEVGSEFTDLPSCLSGLSIFHGERGHYLSGYLRNFRVNLSDNGISLKGSLAKYWLNDNIGTLQRQDIQRAINEMCSDLNLDISTAKVNRLDLAQNFILRYKPELYCKHLGDCQYLARLEQSGGLLYKSNTRQMAYYNKVREIRHRRLEVPSVWQGKNVLRYESRFMKKPERALKRHSLVASDLYDEKNYIKLLDYYIGQHFRIRKFNPSKLNMEKIKSPKDFHSQILALAYQNLGPNALKLVDELRARKAFEHDAYYSRLKKEIQNCLASQELQSEVDLIEELDHMVKSIANDYR